MARHHICRSGVVLPGMDQALRASLSVAISDEPALKHLFGCKGSIVAFFAACVVRMQSRNPESLIAIHTV